MRRPSKLKILERTLLKLQDVKAIFNFWETLKLFSECQEEECFGLDCHLAYIGFRLQIV